MKNYRIISYVIFPAIIFLTAGIYFLGMALMNYNVMQLEKEKNFELRITGDKMDVAALERLNKIDGVSSTTQVYTFGCQMQIGDVLVDANIEGLSDDYIKNSMNMDKGTISGIVMNQAAVKMFSQSSTDTQMETEETEQEMLPDLEGRQVILVSDEHKIPQTITKIIENKTEEEEPYFYTSIENVKYLQQKCDMEGECTEIHVRLTDADRQDDVYKKLENYGYTVENIDENKLNEWTVTKTRIQGFIAAGITALLAGFYILWIKYRNIDKFCRNKELN